jgi:hypothetical protein
MPCKLFQIIFNTGERSYSATFDAPIGLECKGIYVDVKGHTHYMKRWNRTEHRESTPTNTIQVASMIVVDPQQNQAIPNMCQIKDGCESLLKETFSDNNVADACCGKGAWNTPKLCASCIYDNARKFGYKSEMYSWNTNGWPISADVPQLYLISSASNEEFYIIDGLSIWSKSIQVDLMKAS